MFNEMGKEMLWRPGLLTKAGNPKDSSPNLTIMEAESIFHLLRKHELILEQQALGTPAYILNKTKEDEWKDLIETSKDQHLVHSTLFESLKIIPIVGEHLQNVIKSREGTKQKILAVIILLVAAAVAALRFKSDGQKAATNSLSANTVSNSATIQVNQSSNTSIRNNSDNIAISNLGNAIQSGISNQISMQNLSGSFSGQTFGAATIGTLTINNAPIYTNMLDPEIKNWVSNIASKVELTSGEVSLTKKDILALTELLTKLDERTSDIHRLPDGRTSLGGQIAIGGASYLEKEFLSAATAFMNKNYYLCFTHSQKAISILESEPTGWVGGFEIISLPLKSKSAIYRLGSGAAFMVGSNDLMTIYAQQAVDLDSIPENTALLLHSLVYNSSLTATKRDFSNSFVFGHRAVTNYEHYIVSDPNLLPKETVISMYQLYEATALVLGKTEESRKAEQGLIKLRAEQKP